MKSLGGFSWVRSCWALICVLVCLSQTAVVHARGAAKPSHGLKNGPLRVGGPEGFSEGELRRLEKGKSVKRGFQVEHNGSLYQAGLSYRLVEGTPMDVIRVLRRPGALVEVIPYGVSATTISEEDGVTVLKIAQGKRPVVGEYTVRMEWDLRSHSARFWMDPSYRADIEDIWGVFSAREVRPGLTLVSFGFAFNIRGVASILENKAQSWGLTTADRIVKYIQKNRAQPAISSRS